MIVKNINPYYDIFLDIGEKIDWIYSKYCDFNIFNI